MPGGPYPNQTGAVTTYTTPLGTKADQFDFVVGGATHRALVPWTAHPSSPMVWGIHGLGNDRNIITSGNIWANGMTDSWLDAAYIVLGTETPDASSWGNQAARDTHTAIWVWARGIWSLTPGPFLYGVSMGGSVSLNYAMEAQLDAVPISAIAINSGALDLEYAYNNIQPSSVKTAYGLASSGEGPGTSGWTTKTAGHDSVRMPASAFLAGVPFRFYVGTADSTAAKGPNTDAFVALLTAAAWPVEHVEIVVTGAVHGDPLLFQPADTLAFYQRHAPPAAVYTKYRRYVPGVDGVVPVASKVVDGGALTDLVWSSSVPVTHPREYVKPQP